MDECLVGTLSDNAPDIDYLAEYHQARDFMGTKGTDLDLLLNNVAMLYFNCPERLETIYRALMLEITHRQNIISRIKENEI